jgi:hypothetical protein
MSDFATEAGHWYDKDGNPRYTYISEYDGRELKTTVKQAKKYGWFPSVSGIMNCAAKDGLVNWLQNQAVDTCYANPCLPDETREDYRRRIRRIDREERAKAPDLGSVIHGCIEKHLLEKSYDHKYRDHVMGAVGALDEWCGLDGLHPEKSFYHPLGFGGKCDIHLPGFVCDFKSKDFDEEWEPATYDNHSMQLSAYRQGFNMPEARCSIIFVSTKVPGLTRMVEVSQEELELGWGMFCDLLSFWKKKNRFAA